MQIGYGIFTNLIELKRHQKWEVTNPIATQHLSWFSLLFAHAELINKHTPFPVS